MEYFSFPLWLPVMFTINSSSWLSLTFVEGVYKEFIKKISQNLRNSAVGGSTHIFSE